ncbi:MAP9 protein, partial [Promerops cafer]|nr:MAP9 protein [Promerops cafer]
DELQEATSDYATSKEKDEYSDDFESDEDGVLNDIGKDRAESNSGSAITERSVAGSPLLDDDALQKPVDLENEAADDLNLSFHEKKLQQIMVLEGKNIQNDRKDGEEGCLEGQNEDNDRKNNEEVLCENSESDDLPINELHKKRNQEENQPKAKPQMHKKGNAPASGEKKQEVPVCLFLSEDEIQPFRSLKCSSPSVPMHGRCEGAAKIPPQCVHGTESCIHIVSTDTVWMYSQTHKPPKFIFNMQSRIWNSANQLHKTVSTSDLKLEDNGRKSPSVDSSDGMMKITEGQIITDTMQEVSVNDQSGHGEAKNTSKNSVKVLLIHSLPLFGIMSTTFVHLKRKGKAVPSTSPVSSESQGSLKVLEDKCMQKKSPEFSKVDNLRAAVFQNWLERKNLLLLELKRSEKEKAEILRNNTEKKEALKREESIACYEAWKKKKEKEAKKLSDKKKLEELEEKKPAEQNQEKTEAAQAAFKKWKERKVEYLREQSRKKKQSERMRKKIEEDLVAEKRRVSVSAVEKWNEKKEEYIKKKKKEKFLEKRKREMQQAKKEEKSEKAMEEYERWLENKMRREQLEKNRKKLKAVHGNEMSPPWRPPGKVTYSSNY